jgi:hypothetical protein
MSHSFDIRFDPERADPSRVWLASLVITPVDDFSGAVVTGPIKAEIKTLGKTARRSLSGHLIFERLEPNKTYTVDIDPEDAGYFSPAARDIPVPQVRSLPGQPKAGDTRLERLTLRPDRIVDGEAMVLRGGIVDAAGNEAPDVVLRADVTLFVDPADTNPPSPANPAAALLSFTTKTNSKGNFGLRMRPPQVSLSSKPRLPVMTTVSLKINANEVWAGQMKDLSTTIIPNPIALP